MLGIERRRRVIPGRRRWYSCSCWLVYLVRSTLFVFTLALLFAYLLSPLVDLLDRALPRKRTRTLALALSYMIFVGVVVLGRGAQIGYARGGSGPDARAAISPT